MRILQVVPIMSWTGGMQEYVGGLSAGLRDLGHDVVILAGGRGPEGGTPAHHLARDVPIEWHPRRPVAGRFLYPSGLYGSVARYSSWADVVHAHQPFAVGTTFAALRRTPLAVTFYLHREHLLGRERWRHRRQLDILLRRVDLVVATSAAELALVRSVREPRASCVVWPGVAVQAVESAPPNERPLVLCVGRLTATKRMDVSIRAVAELGDRCDFAIVGAGPERDDLAALCVAVGLDPERVLVGDLEEAELDLLFQRADVFVSMSTEEAFGITVAKALAHRSRTVVSDIPSHREIVSRLGVGDDSLVPVDAPVQAIADAVVRAIEAGTTSERVASRIPTWSDSAKELAASFEDLVERRR